jgi:hypothetical protein
MPVTKITPAQMAAQWVGAVHKFQVNVHNFEVKAGKAAVDVFQGSFVKERMNTANSKPWARWQGGYSRDGYLMAELGTLRDSIKVKSVKNHQVTIHTDPDDFNSLIQRHRGFCYAAVHNNLNSLTNKPLRGPKKERQFIGHSTVLESELKKLSIHIFDGLPI